MTDHLDAYRQAYDRTGVTLSHAEGLVHALYDLSFENEYLGSSDPAASAIISVTVALEEKIRQAAVLRATEWDLIVKRQNAEQGSADERGK
jgi:hypothetical protein